jgi:heme-degrading monooxygenase HmoA
MEKTEFVAINYITCNTEYIERFEYLFSTRAQAIDRIAGFRNMEVLRQNNSDENIYLIMSHWENEECFKAWTKSTEFIEGHKRGFEDIRKAKSEGKKAPMTSDFKTYTIIAK